MGAQAERERVEKLISASHISICGSVVVGLALGRTYCRMAGSANRVDIRRCHLLALACEALTMAEQYVEVAPPEFLGNVLEDAERLRLEIRQLNANSTIPSC